MRILLIEDDENIAKLIEIALFKKGYKIIVAETGLEGLRKLKENKVDLILLDRGLPDIDGLNICKDICRNKKGYGNIPIIIISGMTEKEMEEKCLKSGAIDFIEKPFNIKKLGLKINSIRDFVKYGNVKKGSKSIEFEKLKINYKNRKVYYKDENIKLEKKEYELLIYLIKNRNKVQKRGKIMKEVWGSDYVKGTDRVVDTCIYKLRKKILILQKSLKTVRGVGYILTELKS